MDVLPEQTYGRVVALDWRRLHPADTSWSGFTPDNRLAASVNQYRDSFDDQGRLCPSEPYWCSDINQEWLCDKHGRRRRFATDDLAKAAVEEAWLERQIADLDAGHGSPPS